MRPCKLILTVHFATTALLAFAVFSALAHPAVDEKSKNLPTVTTANVDDLLDTPKLVLLDFQAEWCASCQLQEPNIENIGKRYRKHVLAGKVNVDREPALAQRFGVQGVPHVAFIRQSRVVDEIRGYASEEEINRKLLGLIAQRAGPITSPSQSSRS